MAESTIVDEPLLDSVLQLNSCILCCRNRERQQRFRQRQKAKIESLESQVVKLTAQTKALAAEKEDLGGRALKFQDLLQVGL